jgi:hypothetical protein
MTEAVAAIESLSGKSVMILAPSSPSVEVLRAQGFCASQHIATILGQSRGAASGEGTSLVGGRSRLSVCPPDAGVTGIYG